MNELILYDMKSVFMTKEELWILDEPLESLFKFDKQLKKASFVTIYPEKSLVGRTFSEIVKIGDILFLIPEYGSDVYAYDLIKSEYIRLNIPFDDYERIVSISVGSDRKFLQPVTCDAFLWLVDINAGNIIRINSEDLNFRVFEIYDYRKLPHPFLTYEIAKCRDNLIIPHIDNNILYFDMNTGKISKCEIGTYKEFDRGNTSFIKGIKRIYDDRVLIYTGDGRIFVESSSGVDEIYDETINDMMKNDVVFKMLYKDNLLIIAIGNKSSVVVYDLVKGCVKVINNNYDEEGGYEEADFIDSDRIMLLSGKKGINYILQLDEGKIIKNNIRIDLNGQETTDFLKLLVDKKIGSLEGFLLYISNPSLFDNKYMILTENQGMYSFR